MDDITREFLSESNKIEMEYSEEALSDAVSAWEYFTGVNKSFFSYPSFLHTHYLLMKNLDAGIAGEIRDVDVFVGGRRCRFISKVLIQGELEGIVDRIDNSIVIFGIPGQKDEVDYNRVAKKLHVAFEHIHPFLDGNGRTGRIIYNAHRLKLGLPIHVIHEGEEQQSYYEWFKGNIT